MGLYKNVQGYLYFLRRFRSLYICKIMLIVYHLVVASIIFYTIMSLDRPGSRSRAGDAGQKCSSEKSDRRMLKKLLGILIIACHTEVIPEHLEQKTELHHITS